MDRSCDVCGVTYQAKRSTSRYCSTRCRTRKSRGAPSLSVVSSMPPQVDGGVELATVAALGVASRLDSPLGQACIVLARRLDRPGPDTGSAMAQVAKRLETLLAAATRGTGASSPQLLRDELAQRRAEHRRGGAR